MSCKVINETGSVYYKLTVVKRFIQPHARDALWLCRCDCGNTKIVTGSRLRTGSVKSCGCWRSGLLPKGEAAFNQVFGRIKRDAKKRGYIFGLTKEYVRELNKQPCYYCGVLESNTCSHPRKNGVYRYNGIDRVDSSIGYINGNVVSCCQVCNNAKGVMNTDDFLKWVNRVVIYQDFQGKQNQTA